MDGVINANEIKDLRKKLRNDSTPPEQKFWYHIRNKQFHKMKFRRQCSIGRYIVNFYNFEKKIAIELDGDNHFETEKQINYDQKRTEFLESQGIKVIRFMNIDIVNNMEGCLEVLETFIKKC